MSRKRSKSCQGQQPDGDPCYNTVRINYDQMYDYDPEDHYCHHHDWQAAFARRDNQPARPHEVAGHEVTVEELTTTTIDPEWGDVHVVETQYGEMKLPTKVEPADVEVGATYEVEQVNQPIGEERYRTTWHKVE